MALSLGPVDGGVDLQQVLARDESDQRAALRIGKAMAVLQQLTTAHLAELQTLEPALASALDRVRGRSAAARSDVG